MPRVHLIKREHERTKKIKYALPNNIGDGYLLKTNRIYLNVRKETLNLGYVYTTDHFANSECFPISCLDEMMKQKKLPYNNSTAWMPRVQKKNRNLILTHRMKMFRENHIFHESAHAVAGDRISGLLKLNPKNEKHRFFLSLVQESYANSIELFSFVFSRDPLSMFFLSCNNYHHGDYQLIRHPKEKFREDFLKVYFGMVFMSFMHSNYLYKTFDSDLFKASLNIVQNHILKAPVKLTNDEIKLMKSKFKCGLTLNISFRIGAAEFYVASNKYRKPLIQLLDFDFVSAFEKHSEVGAQMNELIHLALMDSINV